MSKTNILSYITDLYGAVNPLCLKINFTADRRKLRFLPLKLALIGFVLALFFRSPNGRFFHNPLW